MDQLKEKLLHRIRAYAPLAVELSDGMAREPETGLQEYKSSAAIVSLLRGHGIPTECPFAGFETAFIGRIAPERKRRMALLAEYDALRGLGHACGHCASGSASVLAALAFQDFRDEYDFGVDIIGTPDEEFTGTKCLMANQGIFDGYDFVAMVHMGPETRATAQFIALDGIGVKWHGKPAHAAAQPWTGRNALNAAYLFMNMTDAMRQQIIPEARIHGIIKNGGAASNIIPELAEVEFLTRAPRRKDLDGITAWVEDCARAAALATQTEAEIFPLCEPFHELYNSPLKTEATLRCFRELGLEFTEEPGLNGSSDIGNADYRCPAFHPIMGIGKPYSVHTQEFADAMPTPETHQAIVSAASVLAVLTANLYAEPETLRAIQDDHRAYRGY